MPTYLGHLLELFGQEMVRPFDGLRDLSLVDERAFHGE